MACAWIRAARFAAAVALLAPACPPATAVAGSIAGSTSFVLHRPLNPALTTRIDDTGAAFGVGQGNRNLFNTAPSNCELKGYSSCKPDQSQYGLAYTNWDETLYFQYESISVQKSERDVGDAAELNFNQNEYDTLLHAGFQYDWLSFGVNRRDTTLKLREFFSDTSGHFSSKLQENSHTYGYGALVRFWDFLYLGYYRDGPVVAVSSRDQGREFERVSSEGLRGGGLAARINMGGPIEKPDEIILELFQVHTRSPVSNARASLTGVNFEIQLYNFVFYAMALKDDNANYFTGELLRDSNTSFANGVGYNGSNLQVLVGRDPRYFTGMDGGVVATLGLAF